MQYVYFFSAMVWAGNVERTHNADSASLLCNKCTVEWHDAHI
jgi:hypothetical protein